MKKETEVRNARRNVGIFKVINYQVFKEGKMLNDAKEELVDKGKITVINKQVIKCE